MRYCSDLVYLLILSNASDEEHKIQLDFKEAEVGGDINLIWPRQGLFTKLKAKAQNVVLAALPKLRAEDSGAAVSEIEKLDISFGGDAKKNGDVAPNTEFLNVGP